MAEIHCPVQRCDFWVPGGMEYIFVSHFRDEHGTTKQAILGGEFDAENLDDDALAAYRDAIDSE